MAGTIGPTRLLSLLIAVCCSVMGRDAKRETDRVGERREERKEGVSFGKAKKHKKNRYCYACSAHDRDLHATIDT